MTNTVKLAIETTKAKIAALNKEIREMPDSRDEKTIQDWAVNVVSYAAKQRELDILHEHLETLEAIAAEEDTEKPETQETTEENQEAKKAVKSPAKFSPIAVYLDGGKDGLAKKLANLEASELKDIIRDYSLDTTGKYRSWKKRERLEDLIMRASERKATRGDVFKIFTGNQKNAYTA